MNLIGVLVMCVLSCTNADTHSGSSSNVANVQTHSDNSPRAHINNDNSNTTEEQDMEFDFMGLNIRVGKSHKEDTIKLGLFMHDEVEGRKKQMGQVLLPAIVGVAGTGVAALISVFMKLLVFKALALAKLSLIISLGLLISKFVHILHNPHVESKSSHIQDQPQYHQNYIADSNTGYHPSASGNLLAYANYGTGGLVGAESTGQYAIVEAPVSNLSANVVNRRHEIMKRKSSTIPFVSVQKYTIQH